MTLFMVYATVLATLLALAATRVEAALQGRGLPTRWVWITSLAGSVGVGAWALLRPAPAPAAVGSGWAAAPVVYLTELRDAVAAAPAVPAWADSVAVTLWVAASLVLAVALLGGVARLARRARRWVPARVGDAVVLLSEDFGPAVLGVRTPRVVLPRWALGLEAQRLRLVVLHEEEHRRARDVALLLAGWVAVIVAPWNVALWWQFHRLRGAVEVDCDARVLRRGAPAAMYGRLLLEMGSQDPGLPLPVAALSRPPSLLERRLTMIVRGGKRGSAGRTAGALAVAAGLLAVACETPMPTTVRSAEAEAEAVEVAPASVDAERQMKLQELLTKAHEHSGSAPLYMVNGKRVPDITGISPEDIERVEVVKGGAAEAVYGAQAAAGVVHVITKDAPADFKAQQLRPGPGQAEKIHVTKQGAESAGVVTLRSIPEPRIYVDGELREGGLENIDKSMIERVDVVKGKDADVPASVYITLKKKGSGGS